MQLVTKIENKLNIPCNDCSKCPAFEHSKDYWGEVDESCLIRSYWYFDNGCRLPVFVRKIMYWKYQIDSERALKKLNEKFEKEMED